MPVLYKKGLQLKDIEFIESEIVRALPSDYKAFLVKMNGCYIAAPDYGQIPLNKVDEGCISFDCFFGYLPSEEANDIVSFNKEFICELDYLPEAIAIGEDGGGNPFVIIGGGISGVYYWDRTHLHECDSKNSYEISEKNDTGNLYLISSGFSEFYDLVMRSFDDSQNFVEEK